jgi:hypothetical protein
MTVQAALNGTSLPCDEAALNIDQFVYYNVFDLYELPDSDGIRKRRERKILYWRAARTSIRT